MTDKSYTYRNNKIDNKPFIGTLDELGRMVDNMGRNITVTFHNTMLHAAETLDKQVPKVDQIDLIYYLYNIKPHCRSSSYLDE